MKCFVENCKNTKNMKKHGLSFHRFPQNEYLKKRWLEFTGKKKPELTKNSTICSDHFLAGDFIIGAKRKKLFPNAVPIVFQNISENITDIPSTSGLSILGFNEIQKSLEPIDSYEETGKKITLKQAMVASSEESSNITPKTKMHKAKLNVLRKSVMKRNAKIKILRQNIRRRNKRLKKLTDIIKSIRKRNMIL